MSYADLERNKSGWWTRKKRPWLKYQVTVILSLAATLVYCPPEAWKYDQGTNSIDPEIVENFKNGNCKRVGHQIACDYTDKETAKKWAVAMEKQAEEWKRKAGEPTAILKRVCREEGVLDADCPRVLYGMAMRESSFGTNMVGDGGRSLGWFQILDIHTKVTKACKYDLECSARFSLRRMIEHGFNTDRDYAIMAHNGKPHKPATLTYLADVKQKMKLFPN